MKRSGTVVVLALSLLIVPLIVPLAQAQQKSAGVERSLWEAANRERRQQGLGSLKWDEGLAGAARKHAAEMAERQSLSHQFTGEASLPARVSQAGVRHSWLSENIAEGTGASDLHEQFMKSPNHRANILDADMDTVGIGVAFAGGKFYVVEDFCKAK